MTASEVQANIKAGLVLGGYADGQYQWIGDSAKWSRAEDLRHFYEAYKRFPTESRGMREVEPNVWIK